MYMRIYYTIYNVILTRDALASGSYSTTATWCKGRSLSTHLPPPSPLPFPSLPPPPLPLTENRAHDRALVRCVPCARPRFFGPLSGQRVRVLRYLVVEVLDRLGALRCSHRRRFGVPAAPADRHGVILRFHVDYADSESGVAVVVAG